MQFINLQANYSSSPSSWYRSIDKLTSQAQMWTKERDIGEHLYLKRWDWARKEEHLEEGSTTSERAAWALCISLVFNQKYHRFQNQFAVQKLSRRGLLLEARKIWKKKTSEVWTSNPYLSALALCRRQLIVWENYIQSIQSKTTPMFNFEGELIRIEVTSWESHHWSTSSQLWNSLWRWRIIPLLRIHQIQSNLLLWADRGSRIGV